MLAAIEWQAEEFERRTGIHCMVSIQPHEIKLDEKLSTPIFRIFQEALTNIARHAHATDITIHFHIKKRHIELIVKDNGRGITNEQIGNPKSFGIIGIRERAEFLGGTVNIQGISNKGTIVTLHVPIDA